LEVDNGKKGYSLLRYQLSVLPYGERVSFASQDSFHGSERCRKPHPDALRELMEKTGRKATPVIVVDEDVIVGFDRGKLERLLGL